MLASRPPVNLHLPNTTTANVYTTLLEQLPRPDVAPTVNTIPPSVPDFSRPCLLHAPGRRNIPSCNSQGGVLKLDREDPCSREDCARARGGQAGLMNQLEHIFEELGISQYLGAFVDQGFDSWETILDITESDLDALGVKLGHRRKLQRRIANYRGLAPAASLVSPTRTSIEEAPTHVAKPQHHEVKDGAAATKRKYRRHPKPDENAPERPPSAYVLFSNKMRDDLKGQNLSFTEIAKLVGENWQSLDRSEKEPYETQAQELKETYNREMNDYKRTPEYRRYSEYLQDFRKRQAIHDAHKRARVDMDGNGRRTAPSAMLHVPSTTTSNAGSGSESQPGSEPPPTRQQRLSSITSQAESLVSPVLSSHALARHAEDATQSPMSIVQDDKVSTRPRGFSSPSSRDAPDQTSRRHSGMRDGLQPDMSSGQGFPPSSQLGDPRGIMAPISHSPEGGFPSIVPSRPEETRSGRTSISSQFWSRPPSLLAQQSSTGSVSSLSSFAQPRTPSESSLPIHALLSSKPEAPTTMGGAVPLCETQIPSKPPATSQQYPGRPPGDQLIDGRAPFNNGSFAPNMTANAQSVASPMSSVGQATPVLPRPVGGLDPGLDGMSALLRASDIVGRPEQ
ncbi:hypothetical protein SCAR479_09671 [Seiridium cardinale]|uniref:HMG box domain-containing protein n=1 Tax=Seiridium cardinale TaxID=138064 RepID=A0ABR2XJA0_9PEZI